MKPFLITLERHQELSSDFLDLFSKFINNSSEHVFGMYRGNDGKMSYSQFQQYLANSVNLKAGYKSPVAKKLLNYTFHFQSKNNIVVFLLDLSPYMLLYNYATQNFPLKSLQEITLHLLQKLINRLKADPSFSYKLSIYFYSLFQKDLQMVMFQEAISEENFDLMCQLLITALKKSELPYKTSSQKLNLQQSVQNLLNRQQITCSGGVKSIVTISSFHQEQRAPIIFFTPNWYTYAFVNTGGNFGSYHVKNQQLEDKLMISHFFRTKYVFQTFFLDNWQITDQIQKKNPYLSAPITKKTKSIFFRCDSKQTQDIFDQILCFKVSWGDAKISKSQLTQASAISTINQNNAKIVHKTYRIKADSFLYILRSKFIQGWQAVKIGANVVQNTKFKLRIPVGRDRFLYYEANRNKNDFIISIYQLNNKNQGVSLDRLDMATLIQRSDKVNAVNFPQSMRDMLKSTNHRFNINWGLNQDSSYQMMEYLSCNRNQWGKFFKIKKVCFRFVPSLTILFLDQFIQQISFLLGKQISQNTFMKQYENGQTKSQRGEMIDQIQKFHRRVLFTKLNRNGFMRYNYTEILSTIEALRNKISERRFKLGIIQNVPGQLVRVLKQGIIKHPLFTKQWTIRFKGQCYRLLYGIYWRRLLERIGFDKSPNKNETNQITYYQLIEVQAQQFQSGNRQVIFIQKIALLNVKISSQSNQCHFTLSFAPCLRKLIPFGKDQLKKQQTNSIKKTNSVELINIFYKQIKKYQTQLISLVDTYQSIHFQLLRYCAKSNSLKIMNQQLQALNQQLYNIKASNFYNNFNSYIGQIINKYYSSNQNQGLHLLPTPSHFLIATDLISIQGDLNISISGRNYWFFLCTPCKMIYLEKRQKNIYYKFINMFYQEFNFKENQQQIKSLIVKNVLYLVHEQTYFRDFQVFIQGNFKYGIDKIINHNKFTNCETLIINLQTLFEYSVKFQLSKIQANMLQYGRIKAVLEKYYQKLMIIIREFFPLCRGKYYFQLRNQDNEPPFGIDIKVSRVISNLFMRITLTTGTDTIDITPNSFSDYLIQNYNQILKGKAQIKFIVYFKNPSFIVQSKNLLNYLKSLIAKLNEETAYQIQLCLITNKKNLDNHFNDLSFLIDNTIQKSLPLQIISQKAASVDSICKKMQSTIMQSLVRFQKIRKYPTEYVILQTICQDNSQEFKIATSFLITVQHNIIHYSFKSTIFYQEERSSLQNILIKYVDSLKNYINGSILISQLISTRQLPLQPYELWLNQQVNSKENLYVEKKKKKVAKNPALKYLNKLGNIKGLSQTNQSTLSIRRKIPMHFIYKNCMLLQERIPPQQALISLKEHYIFTMGEIINLGNNYVGNTYVFEKICGQDHVVFHFQERIEDSIIKQMLELDKELSRNSGLGKRYVVYYAFCVNPTITKQTITNTKKTLQKTIRDYLSEAVNRKLFDQVCQYLLNNHHVIAPAQEAFIKGQKKDVKIFKFQLPYSNDYEIVSGFIAQHIKIYHFNSTLKSQQSNRTYKDLSHRSTDTMSISFIESMKQKSINRDCRQSFEISLQKSTHSSRQIDIRVSSSSNNDLNSKSQITTKNQLFLRESHNLKRTQSLLQNQNSQNVDKVWFFNYLLSKQKLLMLYGKSLYFLRIKTKNENNYQISRQSLTLNKKTFWFTKIQVQDKLLQLKKCLSERNFAAKIKRKQSRIGAIFSFEIADYVGTPKWDIISATFTFIFWGCLTDYYIQNYLFQQFKQNCWIKYKYQAQAQSNNQESLKLSDSIGFKIGMMLIDWANQIKNITEPRSSFSVFRYQSQANILVKDITLYFFDFLEDFLSNIKNRFHLSPNTLPLLGYCKTKQRIYHFWLISDLDKIKKEMQALQTIAVGFIMTDYIYHLSTKIFKKKELFNSKNIEDFDLIKYFKDVQLSNNCTVKRNLFACYQITYDNFVYASYNMSQVIDKENRQYLRAVDCWINKKYVLFKLIKNIKQHGKYEQDYKKYQQKKKQPFYIYILRDIDEIELKNQTKQEHLRQRISTYRLLVNLIFEPFPQNLNKNNKQTEKSSKKARYIHHCQQFWQMIDILKNSQVNYKSLRPYQGNQKFLLQKLGREYVALLRQKYSK